MLRSISSFIKKHPIISLLLLFVVIYLIIFIYIFYWAFYDTDKIKQGEFISEEISPTGKYTVRTYLNNGGATVDFAVLGVLFFNEETKDPKNIYWQYEETEGKIIWEDDNTVVINGVRIKVPNGKYDYRHP